MTKRKTRWLLVILLPLFAGLLALGWGLTQTREGSRGVLYRVTDGSHTLYLLGSIHVGSREMYPFGDAIREAMEASDTFVYECDTTSEAAVAELRGRMALPEGQALRDVLGESLYSRLGTVCQQLGLDITVLDPLKPWAVINTLAVYTTAAEMGTQNVNEALALGVEKQVQAYQVKLSRGTEYLETPAEQADALESFSGDLVTYLLTSELDVILNPSDARGMDATIALWPQWWREGDAQAFAGHYLASYLEPGHETVCAEYHRTLITARNARMADRLETLLQSGSTCFATVGLLHLALPEEGIPALLADRGYAVTLVSAP